MSQKSCVTEAKNRHGEMFHEGEEVRIHSGYHPSLEGRVLIIIEMCDFEMCESGKMIQLKDKETNKLLKRKLDTNWILKIKN